MYAYINLPPGRPTKPSDEPVVDDTPTPQPSASITSVKKKKPRGKYNKEVKGSVRPRVCFWPIHVFVTRAPQIRELALNTELSNESACSLNTLICLAIPCIDIYLPIIVRSLHTYLQPHPTNRLVIMAPTCGYCGKSGPNLKQCSACKFMKYCNVSCQRLHWKNHKEEC